MSKVRQWIAGYGLETSIFDPESAIKSLQSSGLRGWATSHTVELSKVQTVVKMWLWHGPWRHGRDSRFEAETHGCWLLSTTRHTLIWYSKGHTWKYLVVRLKRMVKAFHSSQTVFITAYQSCFMAWERKRFIRLRSLNKGLSKLLCSYMISQND